MANDRTLIGHAAVFDTPTMITWEGAAFRESIAKGAFRFALGSSITKAVFLRDHDAGRVLGRKDMNLVLREDDIGLFFGLTLPNTELARDTYELVRHRVLTGMSFGFKVAEDEWFAPEKHGDYPHRVIWKVSKLLDVSCCTWPAYNEPTIEIARNDNTTPTARRRRTHRPAGRRIDTPPFAKRMPGGGRRGCGHQSD